MRTALIIIALIAATIGQACLWDRDTLAEEAANKMDYIRIITGRFPRNPPLYYQMRFDRVVRELTSDPGKLDDYDDVAVASDRLGKDDVALVYIEKKRAYMIAHHLTPKTNPDDWYRYYANAGTFHAHLWFRHGAQTAEIAEIDKARELLGKALEINPNAHFGRESAQLKVLEWVATDHAESLGDFLGAEKWDKKAAEKDAKGLAGLVLLGNAWESVDLFAALQSRLSVSLDRSIAEFAMLRAQELLDKGVKPLHKFEGSLEREYSRGSPEPSIARFNKDEYKRLRAEADSWQAERTAFMESRLKAGKHPDVDKDFWNGYTEKPAPEVRAQSFWTTQNGMIWIFIVVAGGFILAAYIVISHMVRRWLRKWRAARAR